MKTATHSYDVAVVGSGPAGSMASLYLARHGVRVAILEKTSLPRHKTCGGGIVHRALRILPFDVSEVIEQECYIAELNIGSPRLHFSSKRDYPIISMTMRDKFDFFLVSAAKDAGADIFPKCRVFDIITRNNSVELVTERGSFPARFVVAADGAISVMARKTGWQETRRLIPALECEIPATGQVVKRFNKSARFDIGFVPSGYGWVFPKKEHLSVGVLNMHPEAFRLSSMFKRYLKMIGLDDNKGMKPHGSIIPVSPRRDAFVKKGVLLTGDAAGLADPITAEGISFAVLSGLLAGKAILAGDFEENKIKQSYESKLKKIILSELRLAGILAKLVYGSPRVMNVLFRLAGQEFTEAVTDVVTGKEAYRKLLTRPMNYFQLLKKILHF